MKKRRYLDRQINGSKYILAWCVSQDAPPMQASWRGEKVNRGGFTVAPYSSSSFTHSRLPAAQASHNGVLPSMLRASTFKLNKIYQSVNHEERSNPVRHFYCCTSRIPSHLCTSVQQQPDTLGLSLYTRFMQRGDGVDCYDVNCCASLYQLLQLQGPALCSCLMHCWPVCPESKTMSCKYKKPNKTEFFYL